MSENYHLYQRRILSFKYALEGIAAAAKEEPNLKFHFIFTILVTLAGLYLNLSKTDWIIVITMIGLVITVELTNTAIEAVVDSFTDQEHPKAKLAKDISAGAVLIVSITAVMVGLLVFLPYL